METKLVHTTWESSLSPRPGILQAHVYSIGLSSPTEDITKDEIDCMFK